MTDTNERMTDEQIEAVIAYAKEEECWCKKGLDAKCMPCQTRDALIQLRTDLAAMTERATLAEQQRDAAVDGLEKADQVTAWVSILDFCKDGLEEWAKMPHNRKWWKRIDGTPIPNDLMICVAKSVEDGLNPHHCIARDTLAHIREMGEKGGK